jgi:DNA-binding CsgD family transcriptional regulator
MATSGLLRERDLRVLTAVIQDGLRDQPGEPMPWAVLDRLHELIPSDTVQFDEFDVRGHATRAGQGVLDGGDRFTGLGHGLDGQARFWALRAQFLPYSYPQRTGDLVSVIRWSDFYTASQLKNAPFYTDYITDHEVTKYAISVPLPTRPGRTRRIGFWRSNRDFSERDRLALQLLRPHLYEVYLDAERRRRGIPHVSRREREVLHLVAQGHSNADIARMLFISVGTVRKHMEHVFDRTGVRTRSAAAALALPHSPFSVPLPPQKRR